MAVELPSFLMLAARILGAQNRMKSLRVGNALTEKLGSRKKMGIDDKNISPLSPLCNSNIAAHSACVIDTKAGVKIIHDSDSGLR